MIPAMHQPGRHWPTMHRAVPPFVDRRLRRAPLEPGPVGGLVAWAALAALVALAVVVPLLTGVR